MSDQPVEFTLAQAAKYCDIGVHVLRKRAERGTLEVVRRGGRRYVTRAELERAGLLTGAQLHELRRDNTRLREELATHRQLVESTQAIVVEQRAEVAAVTGRAVEAESRLEALDRDLAGAGPIRAWRLARERRRSRAAQED